MRSPVPGRTGAPLRQAERPGRKVGHVTVRSAPARSRTPSGRAPASPPTTSPPVCGPTDGIRTDDHRACSRVELRSAPSPARRRRHGQRLGLADDARRGRGPRRVRGAVGGARALGAPHAAHDARLGRGGRRARARRRGRRRGRCGAPAGDGRLGDGAAGRRRPGAAEAPRRHGLAALDRADARRGAGRDGLDRRRPQRGLLAVRILAASDPELARAMGPVPGRARHRGRGEGRRAQPGDGMRGAHR
ncbi:hypothetical protein L7F22_037071 [Adiantum nelumboides]|nr:hypothetical protein [Adiantum nelumboides]